MHRSAGIHRASGDHRALDIVFIPDLSHDLFDQILDGHQSGDPPILVHHQSHVGSLPLHLSQKEADLHRFGDEERGLNDLAEVDLPCLGEGGQEIFDMKNPRISLGSFPNTGYRENCSSSIRERIS